MKLSETMLSNGPVYSILAVYMPLAVLTALTFLLNGLLSFSPASLLISGGLAAVAASFYCDFMKDTKTGRTTADIRGGLVVMVIAYAISSLFRWDVPWGGRFLPSLSTVLASIGTLYIWGSVISLKQLFTLRRQLQTYMASYREKELYKVLFDDADLLQDTDRGISKIKRSYLIQLLLVGIILSINRAYTIPLSPALYLFLIFMVASGICIFGFFGIMRREHHHAAEGITPNTFSTAKHMLSIGVFSAISIVAAVLLASDKSFFSFSLIAGFFDWLFKLIIRFIGLIILLFGLLLGLFLRKSEVGPEPVEVAPFVPVLDQVERSDPSPFWAWLKYGLIALAVAGFIWFLIAPLLGRGAAFSGKMTFRRRVRRIIEEWFRGVRNGLASFFVFIKRDGTARKLRKPSSEEIQQTAGAVLGAYSPAKKREMRQSVTLFSRLIIWGGEVCQVAWKPVYAPGEYCSLVVASLEAFSEPSLETAIIHCGELFEKALYSAELLSVAERKEFEDLVEKITAFADNKEKNKGRSLYE